jgi:hypothetical protein
VVNAPPPAKHKTVVLTLGNNTPRRAFVVDSEKRQYAYEPLICVATNNNAYVTRCITVFTDTFAQFTAKETTAGWFKWKLSQDSSYPFTDNAVIAVKEAQYPLLDKVAIAENDIMLVENPSTDIELEKVGRKFDECTLFERHLHLRNTLRPVDMISHPEDVLKRRAKAMAPAFIVQNTVIHRVLRIPSMHCDTTQKTVVTAHLTTDIGGFVLDSRVQDTVRDKLVALVKHWFDYKEFETPLWGMPQCANAMYQTMYYNVAFSLLPGVTPRQDLINQQTEDLSRGQTVDNPPSLQETVQLLQDMDALDGFIQGCEHYDFRGMRNQHERHVQRIHRCCRLLEIPDLTTNHRARSYGYARNIQQSIRTIHEYRLYMTVLQLAVEKDNDISRFDRYDMEVISAFYDFEHFEVRRQADQDELDRFVKHEPIWSQWPYGNLGRVADLEGDQSDIVSIMRDNETKRTQMDEKILAAAEQNTSEEAKEIKLMRLANNLALRLLSKSVFWTDDEAKWLPEAKAIEGEHGIIKRCISQLPDDNEEMLAELGIDGNDRVGDNVTSQMINKVTEAGELLLRYARLNPLSATTDAEEPASPETDSTSNTGSEHSVATVSEDDTDDDEEEDGYDTRCAKLNSLLVPVQLLQLPPTAPILNKTHADGERRLAFFPYGNLKRAFRMFKTGMTSYGVTSSFTYLWELNDRKVKEFISRGNKGARALCDEMLSNLLPVWTQEQQKKIEELNKDLEHIVCDFNESFYHLSHDAQKALHALLEWPYGSIDKFRSLSYVHSITATNNAQNLPNELESIAAEGVEIFRLLDGLHQAGNGVNSDVDDTDSESSSVHGFGASVQESFADATL